MSTPTIETIAPAQPPAARLDATLQRLLREGVPADRIANRMWFDQYAIAAVLVADRMGLFGALPSAGAAKIPALAAALQVDAESLRRLCRVLHCRALLTVDLADDLVALTPQSRAYWRRDSVLYRGSQFIEVEVENAPATSSWHQRRIVNMLRDGWDPARTEHGALSDMWEAGASDPDIGVEYNAFMRAHSFSVAIEAVRRGVYDGVQRFVDLGGGSAAFALAVKAARPDTASLIFDLPEICAASADYLARYPTVDVELWPGSFFDARWPRADCFNLSNILHDWSPERVATILAQAFAHLEPGGLLVINEVVLDDDLLGPEAAVVFDMLMHMGHRAQQYSFAQLAAATAAAGFEDLRCELQLGEYTILVARKPPQPERLP